MRKNTKRFLIIFACLIVFLGVGYGYLRRTLSITGTSTVSANKWLIYFDDIETGGGNITATSDPTIVDFEKQIIDLSLNMNYPGDKYEFTVYTVNDGNWDACIESVELLNIPESLNGKLSYKVTYADDLGDNTLNHDVAKYGLLYSLETYMKDNKKVNKRKIKIQIKLQDDIDLSNVDEVVNVQFKINYTSDTDSCDIPFQKYLLYVDPSHGIEEDGEYGIYKDSQNVSTKELEKIADLETGQTYNFGYAIRSNYYVKGWKLIYTDSEHEVQVVELEADENGYAIFEDGSKIFTARDYDVTMIPIWETTKDFVARIENTKYETVEEAFIAARDGNWTDNTIFILKDTDRMKKGEIVTDTDDEGNPIQVQTFTDVATNYANVTMDLQGHTLMGEVVNRGKLVLVSNLENTKEAKEEGVGTIWNKNGFAIDNHGKFDYGINDGTILTNNMRLIGSEYAIKTVNFENKYLDDAEYYVEEEGTLVFKYQGPDEDVNYDYGFYFYDGALIGAQDKWSYQGYYDKSPYGYAPFVSDYDGEEGDTIAYLTPYVGVVKTILPCLVTYANLQKAINVVNNASNLFVYGETIYAIREFEVTQPIKIREGYKVNFDVQSFYIRFGNTFENLGDLTIVDTGSSRGYLDPSMAITNKGKLTLKDGIRFSETTDSNFVTNYGELVFENIKIISKENYVVINETGGTIKMDANSRLTSRMNYALRNNSTDRLEIDNGIIDGIYNTGGPFYLTKNLKVYNNNNGNAITNKGGNAVLILDGATVNSTEGGIYNGGGGLPLLIVNSGSVTSKGTTIKNGNTPSGWLDESGVVYIDGGELVSTDGLVISAGGGSVNFKGGTIVSENQIVSGDGGSFNMYGGTLKSTNADVMSSVIGSLNIFNGEVIATNSQYSAIKLASWNRGNVTVHGSTGIYGGHIQGGLYGVNDATTGGSNLIAGGTIEGGTYGVYVSSPNSALRIDPGQAEYTIPTQDELYVVPSNQCTKYVKEVDENQPLNNYDPVLIGSKFGMWVPADNQKVIFFGGIMKGKTWGYSGKIFEVPDGNYVYEDDTQVIKNQLYHVAYLQQLDPYLEYDGQEYNSLTKVSAAITANNDSNAYVKVIADRIAPLQTGDSDAARVGDIKFSQTISANMTLDLNGHRVELSKPITATAPVKIVDNTYLHDGELFAPTSITIITSQQSFTMESGTIRSQGASGTAVRAQQNFHMNGGLIDAENVGVFLENATGTADVNGGTIHGKKIGINTSTHLTVNAGEILSEDTALNIGGLSINAYINGGTIDGDNYGIYFNDNGSANSNINNSTVDILRIYDGSIKSDNIGLYNVSGKAYIYGGVIEGKYGVYTESYTFIGEQFDDEINKESPRLFGTVYGLYVKARFTGFYDGIIVGKNEGIPVNERNAYHGTIGEIPDATILKEDDVDPITGYKAAWIERQEYFVKVLANSAEDEEFCEFMVDEETGLVVDSDYKYCKSLQNAINYIETYYGGTETAILTASVLTKYTATIASGDNIILDLNGHIYMQTQEIVNNGTLTINDSSPDKSGAIASSYEINMINNKGTLTINGGSYVGNVNPISGASPINLNNTGDVVINDGYFENTNVSIVSYKSLIINDIEMYTPLFPNINNYGYLEINDGDFYGIRNVSNSYYWQNMAQFPSTVVINNGNFEAAEFKRDNRTVNIENFGGDYNSKNSLTINNGTFISQDQGIYQSGGTLIFNNGTITSANAGIDNRSHTILNDGSITSTNNYGISNDAPLDMNDGTVKSENTYGINNRSTANIYGGVVDGINYGIYNSSVANIGKKDGNISITRPSIKGTLYGIYNTVSESGNATFRFYDGILKGTTEGYYGIVSEIEEDSFIYTSNEIIDDEEYITRYLYSEGAIALNTRTGTIYYNLNRAFEEAQNNDTIQFTCQVGDDGGNNCVDQNEDGAIETVPIYYAVTVPKDLTVTLDMNGYEVTTSQPITNKGNLKLIDSSAGKVGSFNTLTTINVLINDNELEIDNVKFNNTTSNAYLIRNNKNAHIHDSLITCYYGVQNYGDLLLTNNTINSRNTTFDNRGNITVEGGTYYAYGTDNSVIVSQGTGSTVINNATITSELHTSYYGDCYTVAGYHSQDITVTNSTINGKINGSAQKMTIKDSTISGGVTGNGVTYLENVDIDTKPNDMKGESIVSNGGTMYVNGVRILTHITSTIVFNNSGIMHVNDAYVRKGTETIGSITLFYAAGSSTTNINDIDAVLDALENLHGIYINGGNATVNYYNGSIKLGTVFSTANVWGAYVNYGSLVLGTRETTDAEYEEGELSEDREVTDPLNPLNVDKENPYLEAMSNKYAYGIRKINGRVYFYDGLVYASHEVKPDTTTGVELNYEVAIYVDEETDFQRCYPEYIGKTYNSAQIAMLNGKYYTSLQKAIDDVTSPDDVIQVLKDVEQDAIVPEGKEVTLHLNKNVIYGKLTNYGTLKIYNGHVIQESVETIDAIVNNGTLVLGEDDGIISKDNVTVKSTYGTGIVQNGTLVMNDGYVEGVVGVDGIVNSTCENARATHIKSELVDGVYIQILTPEAIRAKETALILTIDPNGGSYKGVTDVITENYYYEDVVPISSDTVNDVKRYAYKFLGWTINPASSYNEETGTVTFDLQDITVQANWEVDENAIAHIGDKYYLSLQDAFNDAKTNETIELLRDVAESATNNNSSSFVLDLKGYTLNGTIINNGEMRVTNGTIRSTTGSAIVNNKILRVGENDGVYSEGLISIYGTEYGIEQNQTLYMYDGAIYGSMAIKGSVTDYTRGYYFFIYPDTTYGQKAFLVGTQANIVASTKVGGEMFYFNLQDAINASAITGYRIYIERDMVGSFAASYSLSVPVNANIEIDTKGYQIDTGNSFINNGNLTILDSSEDKGSSINLSSAITNNGTLDINDVTVTALGNNEVIVNEGELSLNNTIIQGKSTYAIRNNGPLSVKGNVTITADSSYGITNSQEDLVIQAKSTDHITIGGIRTSKNLELDGVTVTGKSSNHGLYVDKAGLTVNVKNCDFNTVNSHPILIEYANTVLNVSDTHITSTGGYSGIRPTAYVYLTATNVTTDIHNNGAGIYVSNGGTTVINGGTYNSESYYALRFDGSGSVDITDATVNTTGTVSSYFTTNTHIHGGTFNGYSTAIDVYGGTMTIDDVVAKSQVGHGIYSQNSTVNLNGGYYYSRDNQSIRTYNGTINVKNATAVSDYSYAIYSQGGILNFEDSTATSKYSVAAWCSNVMNIKSGTIESGTNDGIRQDGGTLTIGVKDNTVSVTNPVIKGATNGLNISSGTANFYDGIIVGKTNSYSGNIKNIQDKYEIYTGEDKDGVYATLKVNRTYSIEEVSETPEAQKAKLGNGYAKIVYLGPAEDEENEACANTSVSTFTYTGEEQTFTTSCKGTYSLEVWGASGGNATSTNTIKRSGGYGGYTSGTINLDKDETLYINVGGQGVEKLDAVGLAAGGYNGGGNGYLGRTTSYTAVGSGGGATHIALVSGLLKTLETTQDKILIVAGGGGGAYSDNDVTDYNYNGGHGGGEIGGTATQPEESCSSRCNVWNYPTGGSQISGGMSITVTNGNLNSTWVGKFGQGATGETPGGSEGGGGGGFYGGATGYYTGGAGGSGYIGNSRLINAAMYSYDAIIPSDETVSYLEPAKPFLQVGQETFNNFEDALTAVGTNGKITVIADYTSRETVTFPEEATIELDLNGKKLTMTNNIKNYSNLTITDSKLLDEEKGYLYTETATLLSNFATLNVNNVVIKGKNQYLLTNDVASAVMNINNSKLDSASGNISMIYQNVAATIHLTDSTITKAGYYNSDYDNALYARSGGLVTIDNCNFSGDATVMVRIYSSSNDNYIKDSTIINNRHTTIYVPSTKLLIKDSYVETKNEYHAVDTGSYSTVTMDNCELKSVNSYAVRTNSGVNLTIKDSDIYSKNSHALYTYSNSTTTVENTTLSSTGGAAIYADSSSVMTLTNIDAKSVSSSCIHMNNSTVNLVSGDVTSSLGYGINVVSSTLTIGNKADAVSNDDPRISGFLYGVYKTSGTVNFYDGKIFGGTNAYYGEINNLPDKHQVIIEEHDNIFVTILADSVTFRATEISENPEPKKAKLGHGYATITYLGPDEDETRSECTDSNITTFSYTGDVQTYTPACKGRYTLEVWGASGGGNDPRQQVGNRAGTGGYSIGNINLSAGETLYVYVGGKGTTGDHVPGGYNGGGASGNAGAGGSGSGGGATHIATVEGLLQTLENNKEDILIIAGGGGGTDDINNGSYNGGDDGSGGHGGGYQGGKPTINGSVTTGTLGGSQTTGYAFGLGESDTTNTDSAGAGGGFYGGYSTKNNSGGAAGGSGYIGNQRLTNAKMYSYSEYITSGYVAYLLPDEKYLAIGDEEYDCFADALEACGTDACTIKVIKSKNVTEKVTVAAGKNVTLDIVGHELSMVNTITNNGTLTITNSDRTSGNIHNETTRFMQNNKDLIIKNIDINTNIGSEYYIVNDTSNSTVEINNATITKSGNHAILYQTYGSSKVIDSRLETKGTANNSRAHGTIYVNSGTYEIDNSELYANNYYAFITADNSAISGSIKNSTLESNTYAVYIGRYSKTTIENNTITGNDGYGLVLDYDTHDSVIKNNHIESHNRQALYVIRSYNTLIEGNTIIGSNIGIEDAHVGSKLTIKDNTITTSSYGIYINGSGSVDLINNDVKSINTAGVYVTNQTVNIISGSYVSDTTYGVYQTGGTLTIGTDDETTSQTDPLLKGPMYGFYKTGGTVNYYDGKFAGETGAYNGIINNIKENKTIYDGEELLSRTIIYDYSSATITNLTTNESVVFYYTGEPQTFTVPATGNYRIELIGAQGGCAQATGCGEKGGYTAGTIALTEGETLYVYVGQHNDSTNTPAFNATTSSTGGGAPGGGATDIRLVGGKWNDTTSLASRIMVAGGGGSNQEASYGGAAGGLIGYSSSKNNYINTGGSQTGPGVGQEAPTGCATGSFGIGSTCGSTGGGGYYGGGGASFAYGSGSGGSSYISGHAGSIAITASDDLTPKCTEPTTDITCSYHYSNKVFTDTVMIDGLGYNWTTEKGEFVNLELSTKQTNHQIAYLYTQPVFVRNTTTLEEYNDLQTAITEAASGETLLLIDDASITYDLTFPAGVALTLDLNGHELITSKGITNGSNLTVTSGVETKGKFTRTTDGKMFSSVGEITFNNVDIKSYRYILNQNKNLTITNSTFTQSTDDWMIWLEPSETRTVNISDSTFTRGYIRMVKNGNINIERSTLRHLKTATSTVNISDKSKLTYLAELDSGTMTIDDSELDSLYINSGTMTVTNSTLTNTGSRDDPIENHGTLNLTNNVITITQNYVTAIYNLGTLVSKNNVVTLTETGSDDPEVIVNQGSGTFELDGDVYTLNMLNSSTNRDMRIIFNEANTVNEVKNVTLNGKTNASADGIRSTKGTINLKNVDINIEAGKAVWGIGSEGIINYESGTTIVKSTGDTAVGIYILGSGVTTLGIYDGSGTDTADVSITQPTVYGIGKTAGYGVKNANNPTSTFNYYDGKIGGNTSPIQEIPNNVEKDYITVLFHDGEYHVDYYILKYQKDFASYVASVHNVSYGDLQSALSVAENGDVVTLLRDTNEFVTNNMNITLDLNKHTLNGSIINNGNLTIKNGTVDNIAGAGIVNNRIINVGSTSSLLSKDDIIIKGSTYGIDNTSIFKYYAGTIGGKIAPINGQVSYIPPGSSIVNEISGEYTNAFLSLEGNTANITYYSYSGEEQQYIVPETGRYKLRVWGAQGGSVQDYIGGYGAFSEGYVTLAKGTVLYINVGQEGMNNITNLNNINPYNGGGLNYNQSSSTYAGDGGGATSITTTPGLLATHEDDRDSILIVAGGGGGASNHSPQSATNGGNAGGIQGNNGTTQNWGFGGGGTQTAGGAAATTAAAQPGSFGQGGRGFYNAGGGGGAGYYGGGGGHGGSGGGGSSYIGNSKLSNKVMYCYDCTESNEANTLTVSTDSVDSDPVVYNAKKGNGYATIEFMGVSSDNTFEFAGAEHEYTVTQSGLYKLEVWGAQGGYNSERHDSIENYGGYASGTIELNDGDTLYINVGGQGGDAAIDTEISQGGYNGGGNGGTGEQGGSGGGGATHIATKSGLLSSFNTDRDSILIVAGGGGGDIDNLGGGAGGGFKGVDGNGTESYPQYHATGGTQTGAGSDAAEYGGHGSFGQGGTYFNRYGGNGGGGGYYGGGGSSRGHSIGGGGSGYIGNELLTDKGMFCYHCEESDDEDTKTTSTENHSATPVSEYAKEGNGYAKITLLVPKEVNEYEYTGEEQTFTAPRTGYYQLETWGASGGSFDGPDQNGYEAHTIGGTGGYATGQVLLNAGETIYINVGGAGQSMLSTTSNYHQAGMAGGYNGGGKGGNGYGSGYPGGAGGGGATSIAKVSGTLSSLSDNKGKVLIVAGGGGAGSWVSNGGNGGGYTGNSVGTYSTGGSQQTGYQFGQGSPGYAGTAQAGSAEGSGGSGGGWYGGTTYNQNTASKSQGGAGGSGYINTSRLTNKMMVCNNCLESEETEFRTVSTEESSTDAISYIPKKGNGYARIKFVGTATSADYDYTNEEEQFIVPTSGVYKLETWGAEGGGYSDEYHGGYGGYSTEYIYLNKDDRLYINVGGKGGIGDTSIADGGYNGGGSLVQTWYDVNERRRTGGGATSIAKKSGLLQDLEQYKGTLAASGKYYVSDDILIVAGGGGAAQVNPVIIGTAWSIGGSGGGYQGGVGSNNSGSTETPGKGGTQVEGGAAGENGSAGSFGRGANSSGNASGGGGGFYGGASALYGSGGGSGYIANPLAYNKAMYCYNCEEENNTEIRTINTEDVDSSPISTYAKKGNGYAHIQFIQSEEEYINSLKTTSQVFDYTGEERAFTVPVSGIYRLRTWGAQGGQAYCQGSLCTEGGYGGYSEGEVYLTEGETLYINVGGAGEKGSFSTCAAGGYNGGGYGTNDGGRCSTSDDDEASGGGGGATHIAKKSGLLSTLSDNIPDILIVAGGGGGASFEYSPGHGGGFKGTTSSGTNSLAGTQTSGYAFGQGQNASGSAQDDGVAGGGGGFYGGYANDVSYKSSGSGGSGYIGNTALLNKHMTCYNCEESDDNNTRTYNTTSMETGASEIAQVDYAKKGDGYASIELSKTEDEYCSSIIGTSQEFDYTGNYQEFKTICSGNYKVELYGAAGGGANGGSYPFGSYTSGDINLNKNEILYVYVGEAGQQTNTNGGATWNGGGGTTSIYSDGNNGTGGGATDIRLVPTSSPTTWNEFDSLKSRIMVAAGGAGFVTSSTKTAGGGLSSFDSTHIYDRSWISTPATQTSGYAFGRGANSARAGAGGGYFGGYSTERSGSGGSSYISGHTGAVGIKEASTSSNLLFNTGIDGNSCVTGNTYKQCSYHYSGYIFYNTEMIDGEGYEWSNQRLEETGMPKINEDGTMTGNTGNGYAKITYLGKNTSTEPIFKNITTIGAPNDIVTISTVRENNVVILDEDGYNSTSIELADNDYVKVVSIMTKYTNEFTYTGNNTFITFPEDAIYWYGYGKENISNTNTYTTPGSTYHDNYITLGGDYQVAYTPFTIDLSKYNSYIVKKTGFYAGRTRFGQNPDQVNRVGDELHPDFEDLGDDVYVADISGYTRDDMKVMIDAWAGENSGDIYYIRLSPKTVEEIKSENNSRSTTVTEIDLSKLDDFTFTYTRSTGYESMYYDNGLGSTIANPNNESVTYYNIPFVVDDQHVALNIRGSLTYSNNGNSSDLGDLYIGLSKNTNVSTDFEYSQHATISASGTLNFNVTAIEPGTYYIKLYLSHNNNSSVYNVYGMIKSLTVSVTER